MKRYKVTLTLSTVVETNKPEDVQEIAESEIGFGRYKVDDFDCDNGVAIGGAEYEEKENVE